MLEDINCCGKGKTGKMDQECWQEEVGKFAILNK